MGRMRRGLEKRMVDIFWRLAMTAMILGMVEESGVTQPADANYEEGRVPSYTLPDALVMESGEKVKDAVSWRRERRPEILELFEREVYGRTPAVGQEMRFEVRSEEGAALEGKAVRKEVTIHLAGGLRMELLMYLPKGKGGRVPMFLGLNFNGNQTVHADPGITASTNWNRANRAAGLVDREAVEASRGTSASRWPVEVIMGRGYGLATVYYGDLEADHVEGWRTGVRSVIGREAGEEGFAPDDWGAIGAWAWGLSRVMDYLEQDAGVDAERVVLIGHSRLGKTALWAGAQDERFAVVISNNSGCGGAALSRRGFGETVGRINGSFPHWFCGNFKRYNGREGELPVDQHELIALIAPRPVYVASASEDLWADPRGEFLSALHAESVYRLLGRGGLGVVEMPEEGEAVGDVIGYHLRRGKHDVTMWDWERYLDFADRHLGRR
jgi:hypothetical protein